MEAQQEFDAKYVSSTELCRELGVTRATILNARRRGDLPEPVRIDRPDGSPHVLLWLRGDVQPYVDSWRSRLAARRGSAQ